MTESKQDRKDEAESTAAPEALGYSQAMAELEAIAKRIEDGEIDLDRLAIEARRASELLDLCRGKIIKAEVEVNQIVDKLDEGPIEA